jgi:uncharacterized membrane protein
MKRSHLVIFSAALGIIVASVIMSAYFWQELPQTIPIHFNYFGVADSWVTKNFFSLYLIPIIHLLLFGLFLLLYRYPQYTHWPETLILMTVEKDKREKVFEVLRSMNVIILLLISLLFGYLQFGIIATATERSEGLFTPILIGFVIAVFAVIIGINIKMFIVISKIRKEDKKLKRSH